MKKALIDKIKNARKNFQTCLLTDSEVEEVCEYIDSTLAIINNANSYKEHLQNELLKSFKNACPNLNEKIAKSVVEVMTIQELTSFLDAVNDMEKRGLTLREFLEIKQTDIDTYDTYYDAVVTCCYINKEEFDNAIKNDDKDRNYYRFCRYIYNNAYISDISSCTCDWTGFVKKHVVPLKKFMRKYWKNQYEYEHDFVFQWIKEIHLMLAGHVTESDYAELLNMLEKSGFAVDADFYKEGII